MAGIDPSSLPPAWGVRPVLFSAGSVRVESYPFFVGLGIATGLLVFVLLARRQRRANEQSFFIILAGLFGGAIGAKLPIWIASFPQILAHPSLTAILSGRTIVGGLIGGTLAVWVVKRKLGIRQRIGNAIAPGIAAGLAVGRWGCFLRGCCYGKPTSLPWGVDFGDGVARHPTQLYESLFATILFVVLLILLRKKPRDGLLLTLFMMAYFGFRFLIEFIRVEPVLLLGLTGFQIASLIVLCWYGYRLFTYTYGHTSAVFRPTA